MFYITGIPAISLTTTNDLFSTLCTILLGYEDQSRNYSRNV
uniref:Uncharacterized protein n=1 Tax=Anguilla anguilla TaxID=7936 RepID=A0A0E9WCB0_ANGAN